MHKSIEKGLSMPFLDILNRMEQLEIINSSDEWLQLRETRNLVAHEYPDSEKENAEALNALKSQSENLIRILESVQGYMASRNLA